jgi:hypothetical protein
MIQYPHIKQRGKAMRTINQLIDAGTVAKRSMVTLGDGKPHWGGYVAFVVDGKLHERVVYHKDINYILFRKEVIAIEPNALKPISGAWNKESLYA